MQDKSRTLPIEKELGNADSIGIHPPHFLKYPLRPLRSPQRTSESSLIIQISYHAVGKLRPKNQPPVKTAAFQTGPRVMLYTRHYSHSPWDLQAFQTQKSLEKAKNTEELASKHQKNE